MKLKSAERFCNQKETQQKVLSMYMSDRLASMGIYDLTEGKGAVEEEGDYTQTNRKGIDELVKDMILF